MAEENNKPTLKANEEGTYHGIFLAPINHLQRLREELTRMAETDTELAQAIAEGKKTFEGCDRYVRNNMSDLMREMHAREITFCDADVHLIARYYFVNPDCTDVANVANEVAKAKAKEEPKKEPKKAKKGKTIPLTEAMGDLFAGMD